MSRQEQGRELGCETASGPVVSDGEVAATMRAEVVEQLMRGSGDEVAVDAAASASTRQQLLAAVGVVLANGKVPLPLGSPVMALAGFGVVDPCWRSVCSPAPESLWSQVEFYRKCGWSAPAECPFVELLAAREVADRHIS